VQLGTADDDGNGDGDYDDDDEEEDDSAMLPPDLTESARRSIQVNAARQRAYVDRMIADTQGLSGAIAGMRSDGNTQRLIRRVRDLIMLTFELTSDDAAALKRLRFGLGAPAERKAYADRVAGFVKTFEQWVEKNPEAATSVADAYMLKYISRGDGEGHVSIRLKVAEMRAAWKKVNVFVSPTVHATIEKLSVTEWRAREAARKETFSASKRDGVSDARRAEDDVMALATRMTDVREARAAFQSAVDHIKSGVAGVNVEGTVMTTLEGAVNPKPRYRKTDEVLFSAILKVVAYCGIARATGQRAASLLPLPLSKYRLAYSGKPTDIAFKEGRMSNATQVEGVFVCYETSKNGTVAGRARKGIVRVVPHRNAAVCSLVAMAAHVAYAYSTRPGLQIGVREFKPFATKTPYEITQDKIDSTAPYSVPKQAGKDVGALLDVVRVMTGQDLRWRKLHLMRSVCAAEMQVRDVNESTRRAHAGWVGKHVEQSAYTSPLNPVWASSSAYALADRFEDGVRGAAHPMWKLLDSVPDALVPATDSDEVRYFLRVAVMAAAAGHVSVVVVRAMGLNASAEFATFKRHMDAHLAADKADAARSLRRSPAEVRRERDAARAENVRLTALVQGGEAQIKSQARHIEALEAALERARAGDFIGDVPAPPPPHEDEASAADAPPRAPDALTSAVAELVTRAKEPDFPARVLEAVRGPLGSLIDAVTANDGIGLPSSGGPGKNLMSMLRLAAVQAQAPQLVQRDSGGASWLVWIRGLYKGGGEAVAGLPAKTTKWSALRELTST